ncbi:MAG: hypothetical protein HYY17_05700 [Planctomycetes bacterium]|nr:hypothetical protein [Planctomycetota bacterium]
MVPSKDAILGRIAVERGFLTEQQLVDCVKEQALPHSDPNQTIGRSSGLRPLSQVLLAKGYIQETDLLTLFEEQTRRVRLLEEYQKMLKVELLFGQLLVKNNKATQNQINKCLELQEQMVGRGVSPIPRLGELLVEHGYIDKQTVQDTLKIQNKDILYCTGCSRQYNVVGVKSGMTYRCKSCGGILVPKTLLDSLKVDETRLGSEPDASRPEGGR